jgi:WD40 repeat protein
MHYTYWLRMNLTHLVKTKPEDLSIALFTSCTALQPLTSIARNDAVEFLKKTHPSQDLAEPFQDQYWKRAIAPAKEKDFGNLLAKFRGHTQRVFCGAWSPDNSKFVSGGEEGVAYVWLVRSGDILSVLLNGPRFQSFWCLTWRSEGDQILAGDAVGKIHLFDALSGSVIRSYPGHDSHVIDLAWNSLSTCFVSSSRKAIGVWDAHSGANLWMISPSHTDGGFGAVRWSPKTQDIIVGTTEGTICLLEAITGNQVCTLLEKTSFGNIDRLLLDESGAKIAAAGSIGDVFIFDLHSRELLQKITPTSSVGRSLLSLAWSPNGEIVYATCGDAYYNVAECIVTDLRTNATLYKFDVSFPSYFFLTLRRFRLVVFV